MPDLYDNVPWQSAALSIGNYGLGCIPNITGSLQTGHSLGLFGSEGTGALRRHSDYGGSVGGSSGSYSKGFTFDASRSSSLYINGQDRVVPSYCTVYYIIKY